MNLLLTFGNLLRFDDDVPCNLSFLLYPLHDLRPGSSCKLRHHSG